MKLRLPDAAATTALGAALAEVFAPHPGLVMYLQGDLGAGKTTLARGLLRQLGAQGPVRSPSYTLVEPYELRGHSLLHVDLYRLNSAEELDNLGLTDYPPEASWWLVEWPERGAGRLPAASLTVCLSRHGDERLAAIRPAAGVALNFDALAAVCPALGATRSEVLLEE